MIRQPDSASANCLCHPPLWLWEGQFPPQNHTTDTAGPHKPVTLRSFCVTCSFNQEIINTHYEPGLQQALGFIDRQNKQGLYPVEGGQENL